MTTTLIKVRCWIDKYLNAFLLLNFNDISATHDIYVKSLFSDITQNHVRNCDLRFFYFIINVDKDVRLTLIKNASTDVLERGMSSAFIPTISPVKRLLMNY